MAISNLNNELYDDAIEEMVSSTSFTGYVPEKPVTIRGEEKEIKESIFDDAKEALKNLSDTIGKEKNPGLFKNIFKKALDKIVCLLYTSDAADDSDRVDLGGRRFSSACQTPISWSACGLSTTGAFRSSSNRTDTAHAAIDTVSAREQATASSRYKFPKDKIPRQQTLF